VNALRLLLVSGSTRPGSSNTLALQALHKAHEGDVVTDLYDGLRDLPAFVPDAPPTAVVTDLLTRITTADAVVFSTPEYAGALPGSLKNLLDWTVGGGELYGKPVAWLDVANPGRGEGARAELRTILGYVGAPIVEDACVHIGLPIIGEFKDSFGEDDGTIFGLPDTSVQIEIIRAHQPERSQHPYWQANGAETYRDPDGRDVVYAALGVGTRSRAGRPRYVVSTSLADAPSDTGPVPALPGQETLLVCWSVNNAIMLTGPAAATATVSELAPAYADAGVDVWALWLPSRTADFDAPDSTSHLASRPSAATRSGSRCDARVSTTSAQGLTAEPTQM
jgi:NAD(P)H-dependent FMN reductase